VATVDVLDEGRPGDDRAGADVGRQAAHRLQPVFQLGVVSFDPVVGIPPDAMPRRGNNLFEYPEIAAAWSVTTSTGATTAVARAR
jgi:hypothetical protein